MVKKGKEMKKAGKKSNKKEDFSTKQERLKELGILSEEEVAAEEKEESEDIELREDEDEIAVH